VIGIVAFLMGEVTPADGRDLAEFTRDLGAAGGIGALVGLGVSQLAEESVKKWLEIETGALYTFVCMFIGACIGATIFGVSGTVSP
jgi:hypothetical protein